MLEGTKRLKNAGISSAALDSRVLLSFVTSYSPEDLILRCNEHISSLSLCPVRGNPSSMRPESKVGCRAQRTMTKKEFFKLIARREKLEPIAYIVGQKEFYGLDFKVNKNVLIPRPDSETVIELAKSYFSPGDELSILDLGTGSGCLVLTLLSLFTNSLSSLRTSSRNLASRLLKGSSRRSILG